MENGDPEIGCIETLFDTDTVIVTAAGVRLIRTCADCSTELKDCNTEGETRVELSKFEGWAELTEAQRTKITEQLATKEIEITSENGGADVDEGGGGRYKKNLISTCIHFTLTINCEIEEKKTELTYSGDIEIQHAAGEFEECG